MDELIDILDAEGNLTGQTAMKSEAHKKGLYHQTVHVWFYTSDGKVLLQQRGKAKDTHPLLWDVSVAGHIGAGEEIELAAVREVEEELGLSIFKDDLKKIGFFSSFVEHGKDLIDNEFHHSFKCKLKVPILSLRKQDSEIEDLTLVSISQFEEELVNPETKVKYVPHGLTYYSTIVDSLK